MAVLPFRRRLIPYRFFHANYIIIGLNLLVYVSSILISNYLIPLLLIPGQLFNDYSFWQLLTYHFINNSIWVLMLNLLGLFFFGGPVEREMGSIEYLLFYFGIGIVAGLFNAALFYVFGWYVVPIFGCTVVISAILVAYAAFYPDSVIYFMGIFPLRAPILVLFFMAISALSILLEKNFFGLIGFTGFLFGFLYTLIRYKTNPFKHLFRK